MLWALLGWMARGAEDNESMYSSRFLVSFFLGTDSAACSINFVSN